MTSELKPCPFCGSEAVMGPWAAARAKGHAEATAVECVGDLYDCPVQPGATGWTEAEAIAAWNRREPAPQGAEGEALDAECWRLTRRWHTDRAQRRVMAQAKVNLAATPPTPEQPAQRGECRKPCHMEPGSCTCQKYPTPSVPAEDGELLIKRAEKAADALVNWRDEMPAVWYGNERLIEAASVISNLIAANRRIASTGQAEALERAAEEIERGHAWITAVGASAIIRKHRAMLAAADQPGQQS